MNIIDIIIVAFFCGGLIYGYTQGFIRRLISIASMVIAFIVAYQFNKPVGELLQSWFPAQSVEGYGKVQSMVELFGIDIYFYQAVAFALLFFGIKILLSVVGRVLHLVSYIPGIGMMNRWAGALLAGVEALLIIIVLAHVLPAVADGTLLVLLAESKIVPYIIEHTPAIISKARIG